MIDNAIPGSASSGSKARLGMSTKERLALKHDHRDGEVDQGHDR